MGLEVSPPTNLSTALATYAIDDQDAIDFLVPLSNVSLSRNQILFETTQLYPGQHTLVVTYLGDNTTEPLALNYFVQEDATSSTKSSNSTPTSSTSTSVPSGSSSNSSPSSSTSIHTTDAIIGGVIGGLVLISLLLGLFFFNRRRNNRRLQALTVPSPNVVNPFTVPSSNPTSTFLPQNYTSNGQSLPSQSIMISSKFTQRGQPSDPSSSSGGIPPLTPLRFSSSAFISSSSSPLPLTRAQTNLDGTRTRVPQAATEPSMQRSPSPQGANVRFLQLEDSSIRIPPAEDVVVELPPFYTPG
jgi:hypothetical protein